VGIVINTEFHELFATPLWILKPELPEGAYEWALNIEQSYESEKVSNRGGYQSPRLPMNDMPYKDHLLGQLDFFPEFHYDNYWVNINRKGDYNLKHTHPLSDFAVVWNITHNRNKLVIQNPLNHSRHKNNDEKELNIKAGHITVFPSDVPHYVEPHDLDIPRISVAFNITTTD
tara:strand:- start:369 stop:887 length:519 start_codon:yes stop_codon:yes gene_type:complete